MAWFLTSDWNELQGFRQDLLLEFMEIVERAGSAFALPTQTLHLVDDGAKQDAAPDRLDGLSLKARQQQSS